MEVIKRDGRREPMLFDKITSRITKLSWGVDARVVDPALAVVDGLPLSPGGGRLTLLTSGEPRTLLDAATALGLT